MKTTEVTKTTKAIKIMMWISYVCLLICSIYLFKFYKLDYYFSERNYKEIKEAYYNEEIYDSTQNELEDPNDSQNQARIKKFEELSEINKDIIGWIRIENTVIDYPILKNSDDYTYYYLKYDYKKVKSRGGSIVLDVDCNDLNSKNCILHGHSMRNGTMFAALLKFCNIEFYKATPTIEVDTPNECRIYKIISVFRTNTLKKHGKVFKFWKTRFKDDSEFMEFINEVYMRSLINIPVDTEATDEILTLSTCSYEHENFRTVLVGRKLRKNESKEVDLKLVSKNKNPVLPEICRK